MKIIVTFSVLFVSGFIAHALILDPVKENVVHLQASHPPTGVPGIWRKKTIWKARWVKEWKTVIKPVWRKVWTPFEIREWVPVPKPPPNWNVSTPLLPIHEEEIPPWKPMPYPSTEPTLEGYPPVPCEPDEICDKPSTDSNGVDPDGYYYPKPEIETSSETSIPEATTSDLIDYTTQFPSDSDQNSRPPSQLLSQPSEYLLPPPMTQTLPGVSIQQSRLIGEYHLTEGEFTSNQSSFQKLPFQKEVSPYAIKLAQAVIHEKFNRSKNVSEKPNFGLTQVIFKNGSTDPEETTPITSDAPTSTSTTTTTSSSLHKTLKSFLISETTTQNPTRVFIVTPISKS